MIKDTKNAVKFTFRTPEYCDHRSYNENGKSPFKLVYTSLWDKIKIT